MDTQKEIEHLFSQYIAGTISHADLNRLLQLIDDEPGNDLLKAEILKFISGEPSPKLHLQPTQADAITKDAWKVIKNHTSQNNPGKKNLKLWIYAVASAIVLIPLISLLILNLNTENGSTINIGQNDILAGTNKATLKLSNGQHYTLNEKQSGILVNSKGISYANGTAISAQTESQQATLIVPKAGQYQVTLSDGTLVKLNSASTLTYSTQFTGSERLVELEGEAYFEVAKNKNKPFKVKSKGQTVTVLGTHFNVHAYSKEPIETTLLEGSISLQPDIAQSQATILKPGQQASFNNNTLRVSAVNTEDAIAWANNLFVFNNMPMSQIMKQLERWYDVEVIYPDNLASETLYAEIPKDRKLTQVLAILEKASTFHFKLEGRRLSVSQ